MLFDVKRSNSKDLMPIYDDCIVSKNDDTHLTVSNHLVEDPSLRMIIIRKVLLLTLSSSSVLLLLLLLPVFNLTTDGRFYAVSVTSGRICGPATVGAKNNNKKKKNKNRCYPCQIPSTVVTCLVENGVFLPRDRPETGDNGGEEEDFEDAVEKIYYQDNLAKIPDVNDTGRDFYIYDWYLDFPYGDGSSNSVEFVDDDTDNTFYFVHFRGIGYQSTMYYYTYPSYYRDTEKLVGIGGEEQEREKTRRIEILSTRGMWHRHFVDVTEYIRNKTLETNFFLRIEPPLHPGIVSSACPSVDGTNQEKEQDDQEEPCGQGGDHQLAHDAGAMQFSAGWDWVQGIPDRVTGLFDKVEIVKTGPVRISDSFLQTHHIMPSASTFLKRNLKATARDEVHDVNVSISTTLVNNFADRTASGRVKLTIFDRSYSRHNDGDDSLNQDFIDSMFNRRRNWKDSEVSFDRNLHSSLSLEASSSPSSSSTILELTDTVKLLPGESVVYRWNGLLLENIKLWWPHTLGKQPLYTVRICFSMSKANTSVGNFVTDDERENFSDCDEWRAGIRTVSTKVSKSLGGRYFLVNNQKIFLSGGNWISTDAMLQRSSKSRYFDEVLLHRHAGLNLIRVWGGGLTERPEFYEACDQLGILVMQEFWMSGDNNGRWAGSYNFPDDHSAYLAQAKDMVLMIRRHPSLLFYCGGNELWPPDKNPPMNIQEGLQSIVRSFDDRFLIMSSMDGGYKGGDMNLHDDHFALAVEDGPYDFLSPVTYWRERNPGMKNGTTATVAFQPEIGSSGMPRYHNLKRMGLVENETDFPRGIDAYVPRLWRYHKFQGYGIRHAIHSISDGIAAYGEPKTVRDFVARAQLVCLQQYQSLFEGFSSKMFAPASEGGKSAVLMWKTQSPWPALRGFIYDWWLGSTGSLIGVQKGTGGDLQGKVQLNWNKMLVEIVNRGRTPLGGITSFASVEFYDLHGHLVSSQGNITIGVVDPMSVAQSNARNRVLVPEVSADQVLFVKVMLSPYRPTWYWVFVNRQGSISFGYKYQELGFWRERGPFPNISGCIIESSMRIHGNWWTGIVSLSVDPLTEAIAFAPEFSIYNKNSKHPLLPLLADSPVVFLNNGVATNVTIWAKMDAGQAPDFITVDFWAGRRLRIIL